LEPSWNCSIPDALNGAQPLSRLLASGRLWAEAEVWQLLRSILPSLNEFHQQQIIYQGLQPATIFLQADGQFSLAPRTSSLMWHEDYVAPEQLRGQATIASDFYSLGLICWQALTGQTPFALWDSVEQQWHWLEHLSQPLSHRLQTVLLRMIAPCWVDRYATVADVLQALGLPTLLRQIQTAQGWHCACTLTGHTADVTSLVLDATRDRLYSTGADYAVQVWDLGRGQAIAKLQNPTQAITGLSLDPTGQYLAAASDDNRLHLWDVTFRSIVQILENPSNVRQSICFSPDGQWLMSGGDHGLRVWDWRSGEMVAAHFGDQSAITSLALSPDGQLLATASDDRRVQLWDWRSGRVVKLLQGHAGPVRALAFSADGQWLATGSDDQTIRVWGVQQEEVQSEVVQVLPGHAWAILALAFDRTGERLISGSWQPGIRLWDWQRDESWPIAGHDDFVTAVVFDPKRERWISGSRDRTIKIWQADATRAAINRT
jgi:WD40 repeat protein